jgi:hypothetical protein
MKETSCLSSRQMMVSTGAISLRVFGLVLAGVFWDFCCGWVFAGSFSCFSCLFCLSFCILTACLAYAFLKISLITYKKEEKKLLE